MQPEQKKKVFIMAGALGLLLIGACVFLFLSKGKNDPTAPPATSAAPPPPAVGMPAGTPTTGAPASVVVTPPSSTAMAPVATSSMLPGTPIVVDPFKGCPAKPKPPIHRTKVGWVAPAVMVTPVPAMPGVSPVTNPGPTGGSSDDGGGVFNIDPNPWGASVPSQRNLANANLGRNAGWIASETQGRVTAYFDLGNGAIQPVSVGSMINGWRVKAIDKEYLVLIEEATGREDKVMLQSAKTSGAQAQSMNTVSRNNGWN